jgi:hypothetical protein
MGWIGEDLGSCWGQYEGIESGEEDSRSLNMERSRWLKDQEEKVILRLFVPLDLVKRTGSISLTVLLQQTT